MSEPEKHPSQQNATESGTPFPALRPGVVLGVRYEITEELGRGAFGVVYRALDTRLDRKPVAIKVLLERALASPDAVQRFRAEAKILCQIHHPRVPGVLDLGEFAGRQYIVSAFVNGKTVAELTPSGGFADPTVAVRLVAKLARTLHDIYADKGILHRDVKPANMMVPTGQAEGFYLLDFGQAVGHDVDDAQTQEGGMMGTLMFLAPEQVEGRISAVGHPSDLYSAAAVLYHLLTGRPPFDSKWPAIVADILMTSPDPPSRHRRGLDAELDEIVLKGLSKRPEDRFANGAEFAERLERWVARALLSGNNSQSAGGTRHGPVASAGERPSPQAARPAVAPALRPTLPTAAGEAAAVVTGSTVSRPPSSEPRVQPRPISPSTAPCPPPMSASAAEWRKSDGSPPRPDPHAVEIPHPITDRVHFSLTAPANMRAGHRYALEVWAHLATHQAEVFARAQRAHPSGPVQMRTKGGVRVARGTSLTVQLRIPAFPPAAPEDTDVIEWDGEIGNATFPVHVPLETVPGDYDGTVLIFAAGLQIAKLHFDLNVALAETPSGPMNAREVRYKRAFASYASPDRDAVLARIQGLQKALPELEIFLDVASLRSGEKWADRLEHEVASRDVFYLFWSASASTSEWVEREWRAALKTRGIDYIDPVPLVDPKTVPPPPELAAAHFNDWVLAYMRGARTSPTDVFLGHSPTFRWVLLGALLAVASLVVALVLVVRFR